MAGERMKDPVEAALTFMPAAITSERAAEQLGKYAATKPDWVARRNWRKMQLENAVPKEFWEKWVDDIMLDPNMKKVAGQYSPGTFRKIKLNPELGSPDTPAHEVGHAVSDYLYRGFGRKEGSVLDKLRQRWEVVNKDMYWLRDQFKQQTSAPYMKDVEIQALRKWASAMWKANPEEVFAQAFAKAISKGKDFREATKISAWGAATSIQRAEMEVKKAIGILDKARKISRNRIDAEMVMRQIDGEVLSFHAELKLIEDGIDPLRATVGQYNNAMEMVQNEGVLHPPSWWQSQAERRAAGYGGLERRYGEDTELFDMPAVAPIGKFMNLFEDKGSQAFNDLMGIVKKGKWIDNVKGQQLVQTAHPDFQYNLISLKDGSFLVDDMHGGAIHFPEDFDVVRWIKNQTTKISERSNLIE